MRLYDNAVTNNYGELKTLYPVWYRDVLEMDALWKAFGLQLDDMRTGLAQAVDNGFVWTADEPTIARLEQFLYIPVNESKPLIERKTLVASFSIGNGHIGEREIKEVIRVFTDGDIEVSLVGGTVEISVTREISDRFNLADCLYILFKRLPAHLQLLFRDIFRPVLFKNRNALRFRAFGVYGRFFNRGQAEPVLLNGRRLLDGAWQLKQVFRGLLFQLFRAALTFSTRDRVKLSAQTFVVAFVPNAFAIRAGPLRFRLMFFNNSEAPRIMLDGRQVLNGLWLLNQKLKGIMFPSLGVTVAIPNKARVESSRITFFELAYINAYRLRSEPFGLALGFRNSASVKYVRAQFGLPGRKQQYSVRGSVTMDSMYELVGSVRLDGSRRLNAQIIKEDL